MSYGIVDGALGLIADCITNSTNGVIKLPDGTMLQYGSYTVSNVWSNTINFEEAFIDIPHMNFSIASNVTNISCTTLAITKTSFVLSYNQAGSVTKYVGWIAIGHWK